MNILIAEDQSSSAKLLKKILSEYGQCTIAENGKIAVQQYCDSLNSDQKFDLIFLDIEMPEMNGSEALKKIRLFEEEKNLSESQKAYIVMATAANETKKVIESFKDGCEEYITKPFQTQKIAEVINNLKSQKGIN